MLLTISRREEIERCSGIKRVAVCDVLEKINRRPGMEAKLRKETECLRKKLIFAGLTLSPY